MKKVSLVMFLVGLLFVAATGYAEDVVLFSFEDGLEGWEVPEWAYEKPDHVQKEIAPSDVAATDGTKSLEMLADFPGTGWAGAIVEIMQYFDWSEYKALAVDVMVPADAPKGLKGKIILTVGDTWKWVEMSRAYEMVAGEWVTIQADISPGSIDWRRVQVDEAFRADIRKMDVRVVSNGKPAYSGAIYIDNVRVIK